MAKETLKRGLDFIGVTCVFFCHDGKGSFLLHKRSPKCRDERGAWDCGAGALKFGELFEEGVKREVREEYGVEIKELKQCLVRNILRTNHEGKQTHWVAIVFACLIDPRGVKNGDPEAIEEIKWFHNTQFPTPLHSQFERHFEAVRAAGIVPQVKEKKTIALCASAKFFREVNKFKKDLQQLRFRVQAPHGAVLMERSKDYNVTNIKTWFRDGNYRKKTAFINDHFKKIAASDAILVINKDKKGISGYIGGATLMEMGLAHYLKKKIFVLNPISPDLSFREEVLGLNPIFIEGDLTKIVF